MLIDTDGVRSLVPHAGGMCLLDGVVEWTDDDILCIATSHTSGANPLRRDGRLAAVHLIEYGAQAMAVHGGLTARKHGQELGSGYLAALHDVELQRDYVDDVAGTLEVRAHRLATSSKCLMYTFTVAARTERLASARATIFLHNMVRST